MFEWRLPNSTTWFCRKKFVKRATHCLCFYDFAVWLFHAFPKQGVIAGIPLHSDSRCAMGCNERVGWLDCLDSFNWVYWHFTSSASWKAHITICRNKMYLVTLHLVLTALSVLVHLNMFELWKRFRSVFLDKKARSKLRKGASYTSGYVFWKKQWETPGTALHILFQVPPAKSVMEQPKAQNLDTKMWLTMLLIFCRCCGGVFWMSCTCKRMNAYCRSVMFIWCMM